ncbi:MAG: 50S ribosomal protein L10 [Candidatus Micrarchaeota archaeon]
MKPIDEKHRKIGDYEPIVADWKKRSVEDIISLVKGKKVVGVISLRDLPSSQFQEIKKKLRGKADITVARSVFITKAFEALGDKKIMELENYIDGPSGIIVSNENPFKLYRFLKRNRGKAAARAGMIAEKDLVIPEGATDLPVGPALSELKMAKVDCKIDKGKIVVSSDSTVTKKGQVITEQAAGALSKLGIMPVEIGINVMAIMEEGIIYLPDVLNIDEEQFAQNLKSCISGAINLAVNAGYPTKQSINLMITKAHLQAFNLAVNAGIMNKKTVGLILGRKAAGANALKSILAGKGYTG